MFRTVSLSIIRSFSLYTQQWYMSYRFAGSLRAGSEWNSVPSWSCPQGVSKPVWHIPLLCVQWKNPDDGQSICPKHVDFHSKNKLEKLVHLVSFIIEIVLIFFCQHRLSTCIGPSLQALNRELSDRAAHHTRLMWASNVCVSVPGISSAVHMSTAAMNTSHALRHSQHIQYVITESIPQPC
jgi:hypothetical protein